MKKRFIKSLGLFAGIALSLSAFAACGTHTSQNKLTYDDGVVKAFQAVPPVGDLVSQTAVADETDYLVTVITSSSVSEYRVDSQFKVGAANTIIETNTPVATALEADVSAPLSDLEKAYEEALALSGIDKADVEGFDFDRDTYMGKSVFKVEIEDAVAEYSYTFNSEDFTLLASKTELKNTAPSGAASSYIGEKNAKTIALKAAGIAESQAENFTLKTVSENGRKLYKASFRYDGYGYTIDIDAVKGDIVKFSKSALDANATYPEIPQTISEEEAKNIALAFVFPNGAGSAQVQFRKVKLDYEKGQFIYEVEFMASGTEYEFEIAASDGAILDVEIDDNDSHDASLPQSDPFITRDQAVAKVLEQAGSDAFVLEVDIEKETVNGQKRYFYEVEVRVNGREIEYFVDAVTGNVTLNEGFAGNPADPTPALSEEEALQIALDSFGLTANGLTSQRIHLEREDGRLCYEIKLFVGNTEYKMSLDANSGKVLEREIDFEHETLPSQPSSGNYITRDQAIAAVQKYFADKGKTARVDRDVEWEDEGTGANKRYYYEVEAYVDGREYECYVDALTGDVRVKGELIESGTTLIGEESALSIALDHFSIAKNEARVVKVKLEEDDGLLIYEVEFKVKDLEYSFEIDAKTGKILDIDVSFD